MPRSWLALLLLTLAASGQTFEVASVKPSAPPGAGRRVFGLQGGPGTPDPTRARFSNMGLKGLVSFAYDTSGLQISGPSWTEDDRFDLVATMPNGTTREQFQVMLQNLLAERFKLEIHREKKTISLYSLTVGKGGSKLKIPRPDPVADPTVPDPDPKPRQGMQKGEDGYPKFAPNVTMMGMISDGGKTRGALQAHNEPVAWLVKMLSGQMGAPVADDTGLKDKYDYAMTWIPEEPGAIPAENQDLGGPSLMNAIQEQLGLRLTAKKGPVEFIVIDRAERTPTEN